MENELDRVLQDAEAGRRKYILLRICGRIRRIALSDIVYCEAQGKTQCIHLADDTQCLLRITMAELDGMLSCYQEFARAGWAEKG